MRYILQYLELKYPETPMLPPDADGILAARRLEVLCDGVCDAVVLTFFERMRPTEQQSKEWLARQRRKIDGGVREMARLIADRTFAVGNKFGLGDIAVGTALGYLSSALCRVRLAQPISEPSGLQREPGTQTVVCQHGACATVDFRQGRVKT